MKENDLKHTVSMKVISALQAAGIKVDRGLRDDDLDDFMDYLSSKYMLPIGGMLMAIFILKTWSVDAFLEEVHRGKDSKKIPPQLVTTLLSIGALVIAFIILNEVVEKLFGSPIIG